MEVITGVAAGRVRRQEQPRRAHRHQVGARPAEADRQRSSLGYGSFKSPTADANIGGGSHTVGNFLSFSGTRDRPVPGSAGVRRAARHGHEPVALRPPGRASERHRHAVTSMCRRPVVVRRAEHVRPEAPDRTSTRRSTRSTSRRATRASSASKTLLTANGFVRRDHVTYSPSADPFADLPATVCQDRTLTNFGVKVDSRYTTGNHNVKLGGVDQRDASSTSTSRFGITDPTTVRSLDEDGQFDPALAPFDLTSGGSPLAFDQQATIKQQAAYVQDDINGRRRDVQARPAARSLRRSVDATLAAAAHRRVVRRARQRHRAARVVRPDAGDAVQREPAALGRLRPERRCSARQLGRAGRDSATKARSGIQQAFGRWVVADVGYFNKHTHERLRLRRPVRHADRVSGRLGPLAHQRIHRPHQSRRAPRPQRLRRDGAHQRHLLAAGRWAASCSRRPTPTSASTTTRSSTRRPTFSTPSNKRLGAWAALSGATIRVWSPGRSAASRTRWR